MDKGVVELERERERQRRQEIRKEINGGRRNEKIKIKNSQAMLWVSSPWVSVAKKKGRGDEKNGVKVGVFIMRRSSFVRGGILKEKRVWVKKEREGF
uniref:Uncharacterized protein n=2 Tax=Cucumis melo TaxID=3656 RepID=A0A9I9EJF7_CUCME